MYRLMEDFNKDWKYETEITVKTFANLTDESLNQKVTPEGRDLGFIAWHIAVSLGEMLSKAGLTPDAPAENSERPNSADEITQAFKIAADSVMNEISSKWNDAELLVTVNMYGEEWQKGYILWAMLKHQAHHRAQMTVLMRQAGLKVPGAYGPAKEEWESYGMPPQK